jgi:hypothetical protein
MSGIKAATARLEISAETMVNQASRGGALSRADAAPPKKANTTPVPKVYRPIRANLYALANATGGGEGVATDPDQARIEQIQAASHYRASLEAFEAASRMEDAALDIIT